MLVVTAVGWSRIVADAYTLCPMLVLAGCRGAVHADVLLGTGHALHYI